MVVKAKIDTGLASSIRKPNNVKKISNTNNGSLTIESAQDSQNDKQLQSVSPIGKQKYTMKPQDIESPFSREKDDLSQQTFDQGTIQSPQMDIFSVKPSPALDLKQPIGKPHNYTTQISKLNQHQQQSSSKPGSQGVSPLTSTSKYFVQTASQNPGSKQIGIFDLESPQIHSPMIKHESSMINKNQKNQKQVLQAITPQGITKNIVVNKMNTTVNVGVNARNSMKNSINKGDVNNKKRNNYSPQRSSINNRTNSPIKQGQKQQGFSKFQTKTKQLNQQDQNTIKEEEIQLTQSKESSDTGLNIIQLNTLDNIIEQDDDFTPDQRNELVKERFQKQNELIEQALMLQQKYESETNDFESLAVAADGKKTTSDFSKIEEEDYSEVGNDNEEEDEELKL